MDKDSIETIRDRSAIERIVLGWAYAVDQRNADEAAALFTEDAVVDYGARSVQGPMKGRDTYLAFMREAMSDGPITESSLIKIRTVMATHHISNLVVDFETPDRAVARSYVVALAITTEGDQVTTWSHATDTLVRTTEGWRISNRKYDTVATQRVGPPVS